MDSHAIRDKLAAQDTGNATWRRDVSVSLWKLAETDGGEVPWTQVLEKIEAMKARGVLLPTDEPLLEQARRLAGGEQLPDSRCYRPHKALTDGAFSCHPGLTRGGTLDAPVAPGYDRNTHKPAPLTSWD
jgi:hypothetical protein